MSAEYEIEEAQLSEIKASIGLLGWRVRTLYQCCRLTPHDFLDFLYGDEQVTYDGVEADGDVEEDTGTDELPLLYFGRRKTIASFPRLQNSIEGSLLRAFWYGPFSASSWINLDHFDSMEVWDGEVNLTFAYRDKLSDGYDEFFHCTNPIAMRHIASSGFRNTQDLELAYPPGVYGALLKDDALGYLHFLEADGVWAAAIVKGGFAVDKRLPCKRKMGSGAKQVSDDFM